MAEDLNFIDLVALSRIKPDTTVEKFGGIINSSFFDASNILGSLKQKGLIDFTTSFPGQSAITVTDQGKQVLQESDERAKSDFDMLDLAIMTQLSGGKRGLTDLGGAVNVRQRDLAMHLFKLSAQQYVSYDIRNGNIDITLTEKGFLQVKSGMPKPQAAAQAAQAPQGQQGPQAQQGAYDTSAYAPASSAAAQEAPQQAEQSEQQNIQAPGAEAVQAGASADMQKLEAQMIRAKKRSMYMIIGVALAVIIFIVALLLIGEGII